MIKHNDNFYMQEAFGKLKILNEAMLEEEKFKIVENGDVDDLAAFVADDIDAPDEEEVIDVEAVEEEDLQDTYVGKAIIECNCCHTRTHKDASEVFIDEETNMANIDEVCPVCGQSDGWLVIGQIEPFNPDANFEAEDDLDSEGEIDLEDEGEFSDEEIGEAFKGLKEDKHTIVENENICESNGFKVLKRFKDLDDGRTHVIARNPNREEDDFLGAYAVGLGYDDKYGSWGQGVYDFKTPDEAETWLKGPNHYRKDGYRVKDESLTEEMLEHGNENLGVSDVASVKDDKSLEDDQADLVKAADEKEPAINEGCEGGDCAKEDEEELEKSNLEESVTIDVNNGQVTSDGNDAKVDLQAGTVEVGDNISSDAGEMIAPLEPEIQADIDNNIDPNAEDDLGIDDLGAEADANVEDDISLDAAGPDADITDVEGDADGEDIEPTEGPEADEEEIEDEDEAFEALESFDMEGFNSICESYLKRVYENVAGFETTKFEHTNESLTVEGLIKFNSGKQGPTKFVFENAKTTKRGKTLYEGKNEMFSTYNKAYVLKGLVEDKKFTCEALTYNYAAKNLNEGVEEQVRVYGRCKK